VAREPKGGERGAVLDQSRGHLERQRGVGVVSRERVVGDVRERRGGGLRSEPFRQADLHAEPELRGGLLFGGDGGAHGVCGVHESFQSPPRLLGASSRFLRRHALGALHLVRGGIDGNPRAARGAAERAEEPGGSEGTGGGGVEAPGGGPRRRRFGIGFGVGAVGGRRPGVEDGVGAAQIAGLRGSFGVARGCGAWSAEGRGARRARGFFVVAFVVRVGARVARAVRAETSDGRRGRRGPRRSLLGHRRRGDRVVVLQREHDLLRVGEVARGGIPRIGHVPVSALARPRRRDGAGGGRRRRALLFVLLAPHAKDVARRARRTDPAPRARRCGARRGRARGRDRRIAVGPIIRRRTEGGNKAVQSADSFRVFSQTGPR